MKSHLDGDSSAGERARLLIAYADVERAADIALRLKAADIDLIAYPISMSIADRWIAELQPDLILVDPPTGEKDLLAACRAVRERSDLPIVVLSARGEEVMVTRVLRLGIDEYLIEPVGEGELRARLDALLRRLRQRGAPKSALRVGDVVLSLIDHTVARNGQTIGLSPIEFRLLSCLASAPGTVLTHQTLMARVWGAEYVNSRHYLRLYVRYLREKLEDDPTSPKLILSEWGVGYRFQPQDIASPAVRERTARGAD